MKKLIVIVAFCLPLSLMAQQIRDVWAAVCEHNLTYKALQQQAEAERAGLRVGLAPEDPEVEFAWLWGSPASVGPRVDFSVTQSFDFPTSYVYRSRVARLRDSQTQLSCEVHRRELLLEVGKLYYGIVYQNARIEDVRHCLQYLSEVSEATQQKFNAGECNVFDFKRVRLAELNMRQTLAQAETELSVMLLEMKRLNGGEELEISESIFPEIQLPPDFDVWYVFVECLHPGFQWWDMESRISQEQIRVEKSGWALQLRAGYMREQVPSETFQGVKVGLSLPLWRNLNSVKQSKLQNSAAMLRMADEEFEFYNRLHAAYLHAAALQQQMADYQELLESVDADELLQKALASGQISLTDYLSEMSLYHESHERLLQMQYETALQYLEMQVWE
ncbi:MAG: TolC family protein [Bacteroidales bacterium]|nr:TolC family protein [Bacteroidales bacterium]